MKILAIMDSICSFVPINNLKNITMLDLKNLKNVVKDNQKMSLEQFKSIAINEQDQMDLEKLTGGILGACHYTTSPYTPDYIRFRVN
ncbi:hypothetical protein [Flavobacterium sp. F52]|nr:hypothetical protein [Flavobacterium sp. F52]